jgi:hypothetical protein
MTALPLTRRGRLTASGTSATTRSSGWRRRADRARRAHQLEQRRHLNADRTDRYLDREGLGLPLSVVATLWQR